MAKHYEIYKTKEWFRARRSVILRANGLCERCKLKGKIKAGKEVHHIKWLDNNNKHDWDVAFNTNNLILLCSDCHNDEHNRSIGLQSFLIPPGS